MTSWRSRPDLQQKPQGENNKGCLRDILKRQFREVVKSIASRSAEPAPKPRRRRREEAGQAFRAASRALFGRVVRIPAMAHAADVIFGTLDWLNPWQNIDQGEASEADQQSHYRAQNDLSPHL